MEGMPTYTVGAPVETGDYMFVSDVLGACCRRQTKEVNKESEQLRKELEKKKGEIAEMEAQLDEVEKDESDKGSESSRRRRKKKKVVDVH